MNKCAVIYICTGTYKIFWKDFYESSEKYFVTDLDKEYYIFTDDMDLIQSSFGKKHAYYWGKSGWPFDSMMRWEVFCSIQDILYQYDYITFCNANMLFQQESYGNIFSEKKLTVLSMMDPNTKDEDIPFERNELSKAYVPFGISAEKYVAGGFFGASPEIFLKMARKLRDYTMEDLKRGIVPCWHDESLLNAYVLSTIDEENLSRLGKDFAIPEEFQNPELPSRAIFRNKDKYGGNAGLRYNKYYGAINLLYRRVKGKLKNMLCEK